MLAGEKAARAEESDNGLCDDRRSGRDASLRAGARRAPRDGVGVADRAREAQIVVRRRADGVARGWGCRAGVRSRSSVGGRCALSRGCDPMEEIGRASCWERVCQYVLISVGAVSFKNKKTYH